MPNHGMTPHISGTSLSAQARYAAGTREILECFFEGRPIREEYLIVQGGHFAGAERTATAKGGKCHRRLEGSGGVQPPVTPPPPQFRTEEGLPPRLPFPRGPRSPPIQC